MLCSHARPQTSIVVSHRVSEQPCCSHVDDGLRVMRRQPGSSFHGVSLKREHTMPSFPVMPGRRPSRAMAETGGVADRRQEVFEAEKILNEDTLKQNYGGSESSENGASGNGGAVVSENGARGATREVEVEVERKEKDKRKAKEQEIDWENVPTMPDELEFARRHPMDPHKPNFSEVLPEPLRLYPSFEGWFVRIWDPKENCSAAVILARRITPVPWRGRRE